MTATQSINDIIADRLKFMARLHEGADTKSTLVIWALNGTPEEHRQVALVSRILNALSGVGEQYEAQLAELAKYVESKYAVKEPKPRKPRKRVK